jgi:predicted NBD/HSP70 family sugar kinase/biotin operon repressor
MPDMRYAPPKRLRIADRAGGLNQVSVRSYNERLVLSLLLQHQGMSRMELGQMTGLSAQTVSVIVRSLEQEGLIVQGEAQRGRMGPPTIPLSLNAEGAYSIGISIGYRKTEVVLIDFVGQVRKRLAFSYGQPSLIDIYAKLPDLVREVMTSMPDEHRDRIAGIGLAVPADVESWENSPQVPGRNFVGIENELTQLTGLEVLVQNDTTAATSAESLFGVAKEMNDYLYAFLGARLHQRLVLNHHVHSGRVELPASGRAVGVLSLERRLFAEGISVEGLWDPQGDWSEYQLYVAPWLDEAAEGIRLSVDEALRLVAVETVVVASSIPASVLEELRLRLVPLLPDVSICISRIPAAAKAVGAASLPFSSRFTV